MTTPSSPLGRQDLDVLSQGSKAVWRLDKSRAEYRQWTSKLTSPSRTWTATESDLFDALWQLRIRLDSENITVCCNGARRNEWASGMQRDMGEGRSVYLLDLDHPAERETVSTLDAAPCDQVGTIDEQHAFFAQWRASRPRHGDGR